jgi:hypothetical protein
MDNATISPIDINDVVIEPAPTITKVHKHKNGPKAAPTPTRQTASDLARDEIAVLLNRVNKLRAAKLLARVEAMGDLDEIHDILDALKEKAANI